MSSTAHICYEQPAARETLSGSGNWAFDKGIRLISTPESERQAVVSPNWHGWPSCWPFPL